MQTKMNMALTSRIEAGSEQQYLGTGLDVVEWDGQKCLALQ